jgi:hypothetical protein
MDAGRATAADMPILVPPTSAAMPTSLSAAPMRSHAISSSDLSMRSVMYSLSRPTT